MITIIGTDILISATVIHIGIGTAVTGTGMDTAAAITRVADMAEMNITVEIAEVRVAEVRVAEVDVNRLYPNYGYNKIDIFNSSLRIVP
jgi:hypothetical protein